MGHLKTINFLFRTNGKLIVLSVPILKHFRVCNFAGESSTDVADSSTNQVSEEGSHDPLTCPIVPGQETAIVIEKGRTGLGLSIVGGADTLLVGCCWTTVNL